MSRYVVIPRMRVQNANMQTNGFLLGGVPLFAANMFAHHFTRQLGTQEEGIIYIHHDQQRLGGQAYTALRQLNVVVPCLLVKGLFF